MRPLWPYYLIDVLATAAAIFVMTRVDGWALVLAPVWGYVLGHTAGRRLGIRQMGTVMKGMAKGRRR